MPERSIRFAVRSSAGLTTDIWKVWTTGKRDVYMTSRPLGHALKLSVHEAGHWHVGFHSERKDQLFRAGEGPPTRFLGKGRFPEFERQPLVLAARVYFPWSSPTEAAKPAPDNVAWIECASPGQAVEVSLFLIRLEVFSNDWPGKKDMRTNLIGNLPLEGGGRACLVYRVDAPMPRIPELQLTPNFFKGKSMQDMRQANRMVAWDTEQDGSVTFIESQLALSRR
jgi:hypothetical protein